MDIVLIPGLWLDGSVWDAVASRLEPAGHRPHPLTLPRTTLDEQLDTVLAAVDAAEAPAMVVGHSAAATLAWLAADRRPDAVAHVVLVGGMPGAEGEPYFEGLAPTDGWLPFPGWEPFAGPDSDDLIPAMRADLEARMQPVPEAVLAGVVHYTADARRHVPVTLVCPEFSPQDAREWMAAGQLPELAAADRLDYLDLDTGHWPMTSDPDAMAAALVQLAHRTP